MQRRLNMHVLQPAERAASAGVTNHTWRRISGRSSTGPTAGRAFFFNQEEVCGPAERSARGRSSRPRSTATSRMARPPFTTVNVLALAAANGQVSAYDPTVKKLLEDIRTAAGTSGTITNLSTVPNTNAYNWLVPNKTIRHTPTTNITVNLTPKNRLQGSYYWQPSTSRPP
jgi:hypothetical protein